MKNIVVVLLLPLLTVLGCSYSQTPDRTSDKIFKTYTSKKYGIKMKIPQIVGAGPIIKVETDKGIWLIKKQTPKEYQDAHTWHIHVYEDVNSDNIESKVQEYFDSSECKVSGIQDNRLLVKSSNPDLPSNTCWLNYVWSSLYDENKQKLAIWSIGQDGSFVHPDTYESYDGYMSQSIMFR